MTAYHRCSKYRPNPINRWRIWSFDVFEDKKGRIGIGDRRTVGRVCLPDDASDKTIISELKKAGVLSRFATTKNVAFDGDDTMMFAQVKRNGLPLLQLERENASHGNPRRRISRHNPLEYFPAGMARQPTNGHLVRMEIVPLRGPVNVVDGDGHTVVIVTKKTTVMGHPDRALLQKTGTWHRFVRLSDGTYGYAPSTALYP